MAINFLEKSPTYVRQTDAAVRRRRDVVCAELKSNYKVIRGTDNVAFSKIVAALAAENGGEIVMRDYDADKAVFRAAYRWLHASDADKEEARKEASSAGRIAIDALNSDGLRTWADLKLDGPAMPPASPEAPLAEPARPARVRTEEMTAGRDAIAHLDALSEALVPLLEENEQLKEVNALLAAEIEDLRQQSSDSNALSAYADAEIASLENKVREQREAARTLTVAKLEEIAARHPEYPELADVVERMKSNHDQRSQRIAAVIARLPTSFVWANDKGAIVYERTFISLISDLKEEEQEQLISQLAVLTTQSPWYASLHTRKTTYGHMPHSPSECFISRAADDIRFTWSKNGKITVHWLFRKGDSRVRQTES